MFLFRHLLILISILVSIVISGCGQKGPLYLPKDKPENAVKTAHMEHKQRALATSKKPNELEKTSSKSRGDETSSRVDPSLNYNAIKPESKTNSGTINVSGS